MISAAQTSTFLAAHTYSRMQGMVSAFQSQPVRPVAVTGGDHTDDAVTGSNADMVTISERGRTYAGQTIGTSESTANPDKATTAQISGADQQRGKNVQELSAEELQAVEELKARDREVRAHEMAHLASAGQHARGGPSYTFQQGPDGRRYAIGGEVPIDVGEEKTPEQTIQKMRAVRSAAMAPANPSPADRSIAASASALEAQARQEIQAEQAKAAQPGSTTSSEQSQPTEATSGEASATSSATKRTIRAIA